MKADNLRRLIKAIAGTRHTDYDHTVQYAKRLSNLAIADDQAIKEMLKQVIKRETTEEFDQRVALTKLTTGALWHRCKNPFSKALRMDNVNIELQDDEDSKLVQEKFNGSQSLYGFLSRDVHNVSFYDPNAFIVIRINPVDTNTQKPTSRPEINRSENVLYFEYEGTDLRNVVIRYSDAYKLYSSGKMTAKAENVIASKFADDGKVITAIELAADEVVAYKYDTELNLEALVAEERGEKNPLTIEIGTKKYSITESDPRIEGIQCRRIGYLPDERTSGRTCISPLDPAIPRMEKMVKSTSEFDMSMAMHVFPQKIQAVDPCRGHLDEKNIHHPCKNGTDMMDQSVCKHCQGTGNEPIAKSTADVITVRIGKNNEDHPDLDNIVKYISVDIETPKFIDDFITKHEDLCLLDVFPGNNMSKRSAQSTATEIKVDSENLNDVLLPYVRNFEEVFRFCMNIGLQIRDVYGDKQKFGIRFPDDFDIRTLRELIQDYKDSEGLPVGVRKSIRKKIAIKLSAANSKSDKKEAVRIQHEPFIDKSSDEIRYIVAQNLVTPSDRVRWANYDRIMTTLEEFYEDAWFNMTHDLREEHINKEVAKIQESLNVPLITE